MKDLQREVLDNLQVQRFQENVSRKVKEIAKEMFITSGCVAVKTSVSGTVYSFSHSLGRVPNGYVIISQTSASSIMSTMQNATKTSVEIKFESDPTDAKIFVY